MGLFHSLLRFFLPIVIFFFEGGDICAEFNGVIRQFVLKKLIEIHIGHVGSLNLNLDVVFGDLFVTFLLLVVLLGFGGLLSGQRL